MQNFKEKVVQRLNHYLANSEKNADFLIYGRLTRVVGLKLEAIGFHAPIGSICEILFTHDKKIHLQRLNPELLPKTSFQSAPNRGELIANEQKTYVSDKLKNLPLATRPLDSSAKSIEAEIVGFSGEVLYLMSTENTQGILPGAKVFPKHHIAQAPVGSELLGRIIDGRGLPIDDKGPLHISSYYPLQATPINPLKRHPIHEPLDVGVKAINSLLTVGKGQRIGLFAGSGVGKSVLLSMMTRYTKADIVVVGLIGERGREVKEFIEFNLGEEGLKRASIIATPADTSPLMRIHGAYLASSIAEYFRDQGLNVLLLMDSLTRFAMAQRQLGLAIGEPPTTKGYPPSAFSKLGDLIERAGNAEKGGGSITAFYTVLTEGDDQQDPVADTARSILDGHIVLSRRLAEAGHYPAIDIEASISRVMPQIIAPEHLQRAQLFKQLYAHYRENRDLINIGAYQAGADPLLDKGIVLYEPMMNFLRQAMHEPQSFEQSIDGLNRILN